MKIAFLFPVFNEEKRVNHIQPFLEFLKVSFINQTYQIVFLLNNCTDNTESKLLEVFRNQDFKVRFIKSSSRSRGVGINAALKSLKSDLFAICAIDSAWDFKFYKESYDMLNKEKGLKIVYGPKSHKESKVKTNIFRKFNSLMSYTYLKILFGNYLKHETQCIKMFKNDLNFINYLHNYNYFAETEFYLLANITEHRSTSIPVNVKQKKGSKINLNNTFQFFKEALLFKFFLLKNKEILLSSRFEGKT